MGAIGGRRPVIQMRGLKRIASTPQLTLRISFHNQLCIFDRIERFACDTFLLREEHGCHCQ